MLVQALCLPFSQRHSVLEAFTHFLRPASKDRRFITKVVVKVVVHFRRWIAEIDPASVSSDIHENVAPDDVTAVCETALLGGRYCGYEYVVFNRSVKSFAQLDRTSQAQVISHDVVCRAVVKIDAPTVTATFMHEAVVPNNGWRATVKPAELLRT